MASTLHDDKCLLLLSLAKATTNHSKGIEPGAVVTCKKEGDQKEKKKKKKEEGKSPHHSRGELGTLCLSNRGRVEAARIMILGTKHKTILEARSGLGPIKAYPRLGPGPSGEQGGGPLDPNTQERTFHCEICNVRVNSELQLKQHISSRRHRDGVAGKPNPLLSRHKKHRGADLTDLTKALGAGLLPNPLAVAAAMAAAASSNSLALRAAAPHHHLHHHPHHHPHHHLLQGPHLTHALLRAAPGPIRTAHGPTDRAYKVWRQRLGGRERRVGVVIAGVVLGSSPVGGTEGSGSRGPRPLPAWATSSPRP
ncbi:unnamed protein product [Arctogadus glacialis]